MNIRITVTFGLNEVTTQIPANYTVGDVLRSDRIRGALGFTDNVYARIDGVIVEESHTLSEGDTVCVETRANSKA
jgi:sulfur carrier protein ThiS